MLVRLHFPELLRGRDEPVYVWLVFDAEGRLVTKGTAPRSLSDRSMSTEQGPQLVPGYDTLFPRQVREYGIFGFGSLAPNSPPVMWVRLGDGRMRDLSAFDQHPEMLVLPWIRDALTRHYPALLRERTGPRVELWFVVNAQKQVLRTLQRPGRDTIRVGLEEIRGVFPDLNESNVHEWSLFQGRGLGKLVRDNVRVIWIRQDAWPESSPLAPESMLEQRPEMLSGPPLRYPDLLRHAGIQGQVIVRAIIDTTGRPEPQSVKVIRSPHPGFDQTAKEYVLRALFRPARVHGQAVRALMDVPIEFKM